MSLISFVLMLNTRHGVFRSPDVVMCSGGSYLSLVEPPFLASFWSSFSGLILVGISCLAIQLSVSVGATGLVMPCDDTPSSRGGTTWCFPTLCIFNVSESICRASEGKTQLVKMSAGSVFKH